MYLCICNEITQKDLEENPELILVMGTKCGKCVSDGTASDIDKLDKKTERSES